MFFSCLGIVLVPVIAIFIFGIASSHQLVILSLGSSFFWIISVLLASLFDPIAPTWVVSVLSVIFQEAVRFGFWKLFDKAYNHGFISKDKTKTSNFQAAIAIGWGFGVTQLMMTYVAALFHATGPGLLSSPSCPTTSVFYINALIMVALCFAHIVWNVIAFDGYNQGAYWKPLIVLVLHILSAVMAVVVEGFNGGCIVSVCLIWLLFVIAVFFLWWTLGRNNSLVARRWANI
uniref:Gamma-secretase subunit Aph-1 n=1 Tax=Arcella intermedia TaxID=1963864 RepID=A0A6B2LHC0_9EUKA